MSTTAWIIGGGSSIISREVGGRDGSWDEMWNWSVCSVYIYSDSTRVDGGREPVKAKSRYHTIKRANNVVSGPPQRIVDGGRKRS